MRNSLVIAVFSAFSLVLLAICASGSEALNVTLQVRLVLNSTSDRIYVPDSGEMEFYSLPNDEYTGLSHYYIASYYNNSLKAVVFSGTNSVSMTIGKGAANYTIGADQRFPNSMALLVFSRGSWNTIDSRMNAIENGGFFEYPEPSFGFGNGNAYPIKIALEYNKIGMNSTMKMSRGYNSIIVENAGKIGRKSEVKIWR